MSDLHPRRLLLTGMMAVGKSTVGRVLAERTGWDYLDNDAALRANTGLSTHDLLLHHGETVLRDAESAVFSALLDRDPPFVAGVAAGVVTRAADRERWLAADVFTVWLRARMDTLLARVGDGTGRPWLQPDPAEALRALGVDRDALYAEVADVIVDVDERGADDIAAEILAALARR